MKCWLIFSLCLATKLIKMNYRFQPLKMWSIGIMVGLAFACSKDDDNNNNNNNLVPDEVSQAPVFQGAAGVNWAWQTTFNSEFGGLEQSQAVAVYTNGQSYVNVGEVKVNGFKLTNMSNTYFFFPDFSNPDPSWLEFESRNITWEVSGGSGFSAFSHLEDRPWPSIGEIILPAELRRSQPFTVNISSISNADSVIFTLEEDVSAVVAGNVTSYTFLPAQLTGIKPGEDNAIGVTVTAYNYESINQGGKKIYFGKLYSKLTDPFSQVPVMP